VAGKPCHGPFTSVATFKQGQPGCTYLGEEDIDLYVSTFIFNYFVFVPSALSSSFP
jgi:hypothetical protein